MISSRRASNTSEHRFRNSIPKMYSLNSEASILPRRMSAAANRWRSSCGRVSGMKLPAVVGHGQAIASRAE